MSTTASQIKEHTLSNLAHYLEMFESRAKANGVTVHWAQDAHEHNQIVYQLLSDRNVNELIKSKSMLTEECDTRRFLEERGIRVTETDLGERIQQLDDEPPSHIVGPAWVLSIVFLRQPPLLSQSRNESAGGLDPTRQSPAITGLAKTKNAQPEEPSCN